MQVKKSASSKPTLSKSTTKPKISSPQTVAKTRISPTKNVGKSFLVYQSRDFFNYTPLRQNKSLTCSTPDLRVQKNLKKDPDASKKTEKTLNKGFCTKLKQFQTIVRSENLFSSRRQSYCSQIVFFIRILNKTHERLKTTLVFQSFFLIQELYSMPLSKSLQYYQKILNAKALNS